MPIATRVAALAACLLLAVIVFELVRKKRIREEYSLLWLAVTAIFSVLICFDGLTFMLVKLVGGVNRSSLFFFGGTFFAVLMLLHLTVEVSDLRRKQSVLIQEIGLLRQEIETRHPPGASQSGTGSEAVR